MFQLSSSSMSIKFMKDIIMENLSMNHIINSAEECGSLKFPSIGPLVSIEKHMTHGYDHNADYLTQFVVLSQTLQLPLNQIILAY